MFPPYEVRLVDRMLEGGDLVWEGVEKAGLTVEIKWKGPTLALSSLRRTAVKRNFTRELEVGVEAHQNPPM
jgi:hypothetical protein